jgi:hypothetical protein
MACPNEQTLSAVAREARTHPRPPCGIVCPRKLLVVGERSGAEFDVYGCERRCQQGVERGFRQRFDWSFRRRLGGGVRRIRGWDIG